MSQLPDYLQFHSQSGNTGRLVVECTDGTSARIYLLDGNFVYAESGEHHGLLALFLSLSDQNAAVRWEPKVVAPKAEHNITIDELLFQFGQLEDNKQLDRETLVSMFGNKRQTSGIKLINLSQYDITFTVENTSFKNFEFVLKKTDTLVGRKDDCDVILPDGSVSGHHCRIIHDEHCIRVIDLGSTNGTSINGQLISNQLLQPGDKFLIGSVSLNMQLKLQRKISEPPKAVHAAPPVSGVTTTQHTDRIDPKILRRTTEKLTKPISWKNLVQENKTKTSSQSIFSKMFGKK
ncbi:MAG: FHA domain-containing protein [Verrucomicrobiales bacterium]|nr:FHA domain-containing protein [Verrucomicrobiales bacterium]